MMIRRLAWVCVAIVSFGVANVAHAANFEVVGEKGDWYLIRLESGCLWLSSIHTTPDFEPIEIQWSGGCNERGLVEGQGQITMTRDLTPMGLSGLTAGERRISGHFVDGVVTGAGSSTYWEGDGSSMEYYSGGDDEWNLGCSLYGPVTADGPIDCDPADGKALRDSVVAGLRKSTPAQSTPDGGSSSTPASSPQSVMVGDTKMVLPEIVVLSILGTGCITAQLRNAWIREDHDKVYWGEGDWVLTNSCPQEQAVWTEVRSKKLLSWPILWTGGTWADGSSVVAPLPFPNALSSSPQYLIPANGQLTQHDRTIPLMFEGQQQVEVITASCNASSDTGKRQVLFQAAVSLFIDQRVACLPSSIPR